jgi:hypothetical protein
MLTSAMPRRLLFAFITLAVIGVLAPRAARSPPYFRPTSVWAPNEQALHPLDHSMPVTAV